jgi:hypothetical protein
MATPMPRSSGCAAASLAATVARSASAWPMETPDLDQPGPPGLHPLGDHVRHDRHDGVRLVVDADLLPEDRVVAGEAAPPQAPADRRDVMLAHLVLLVGEEPAHDRLDAKGLEVCRGDQADAHLLGLARRIGEADVLAPGVVGDHLLEAVAALREVPHVERRRPDELARPAGRSLPARRVDAHQLVRRGERQGPQRQGLDDAEDQRVGADAQGQREDGDEGEARALAQQAGGVPDVTGEAVQPGPGPDGAQLLLDQRHVAERAASRIARLLRGQAGLSLPLLLELEMRRQLALQRPQPLPAPQEARQPRAQPAPDAHDSPPGGRITPAMTG